MKKSFLVAVICLTLSACAPTPTQQSFSLFESSQSEAITCQENKLQADKTRCEWEILSANAKKINYPYYAILENGYRNDILLAEKWDKKKISEKQFAKEHKVITENMTKQLWTRISIDEQAEVARNAQIAAIGQALGNAGAQMSAASAPSRLPSGAYELPNNTINCTSHNAGYYTNTTCR